MTYQFRAISHCGGDTVPQAIRATIPSPLRLAHAGLPDGLKPLAITDMLEPLRGQLGLRDEDLAYMRYMLRRLRADDFRPGRICAVWESVTSISDQLGLPPRQINRIEHRLIRAGLIARTTTGKSGRFGRRNETGEIVYASGINFAPLIERATELLEHHRAVKLAADQLKDARQALAGLIGEIRALECIDAIEAAKTALPRLRPSEVNDLEKLATIITALETVLEDFQDLTGRTVLSDRSDSLVRPNTKTENNTKTCTSAEKKKCATENVRTTPDQVAVLATTDFAEILEMYRAGLEPSKPLSWQIIAIAAREYALLKGVSGATWANCCDQLGEQRASLCLLLADRNAQRSDGFRVNNTAAAFIGMVRAETKGKAIIEGLIAEAQRR